MFRERATRRALGVGHWALALVTLTGTPALAQTPIPTVTLDDAVRRAIEKNPTLAGAQTNVARAESLLAQARTVYRPSVTADVSNRLLNTSAQFNGASIQPRDQTTFSATAKMAIFEPARWSLVHQAEDQIAVAQKSTADTRRQIAVSTAEAYLTIIASKRQVDVDLRALDVARAHLDYATRRLEGGAGSQLNQTRAAQEVSTEESQLEGARLALLRSQEALGVLMGENAAMDASAEPAFDVPATINESDYLPARTDVQFQQSVIAAAQRVVRESARDVWPSVNATFTPQYVTPVGIFTPHKGTWSLLLSFSQPIYQGGLQGAVSAQRKVALQQAQFGLTATELQARSEVRVAQASLASLERALASARRAATQAADVLRITNAAFQVGATTNLEVIDAQRSARDADTAATIAEDAVRRARLDLLVALGRFPK